MNRIALASFACLVLAACGQPPTPEREPMCKDDTQCKGTRTCEDGVCVEPPQYNPSTTSSSTSGGGGAGSGGAGVGGAQEGFLPGQCLVDVKCVYDSDCPDGHHCNDSIAIPQCEELYCGPLGSVCSEDELCQVGLLCLDSKCSAPPACTCDKLCTELDLCGFGISIDQCLGWCSDKPEQDPCWCSALGTPSYCDAIMMCSPP